MNPYQQQQQGYPQQPYYPPRPQQGYGYGYPQQQGYGYSQPQSVPYQNSYPYQQPYGAAPQPGMMQTPSYIPPMTNYPSSTAPVYESYPPSQQQYANTNYATPTMVQSVTATPTGQMSSSQYSEPVHSQPIDAQPIEATPVHGENSKNFLGSPNLKNAVGAIASSMVASAVASSLPQSLHPIIRNTAGLLAGSETNRVIHGAPAGNTAQTIANAGEASAGSYMGYKVIDTVRRHFTN